MKTLLERKIELAILKVQREMMREFVNSDIYRQYESNLGTQAQTEGVPAHQLFYELIKKEEEFEATQFPDLPNRISISGFCKTEGVCHYDIDKALEEKFGKEVEVDSESGQFFAYCDETVLERVEAFLKLRYPGLNFETIVQEEKEVFKRTAHAEEFLKEQGVKIEHPLKETFEKMQEIEKLKAEFQEKLNAITSNMVDVANKEALPHMTKVDDKVKDKIIELFLEAVEEATATKEGDSEERIANNKYIKENCLANCEEYKELEWFTIKRMTGMLEFNSSGGVQRIFREKIVDHFGEDLTNMY
jgi:hypothetical protein